MTKTEYNLLGKIIIVAIVLIVPVALILSYDPLADFVGICTEDICFERHAQIPNQCVVDQTDQCFYSESSTIKIITFSETSTLWKITGTDVACTTELNENIGMEELFCRDFWNFNKAEWDREEKMLQGNIVHVFTKQTDV